MKDVNIKALARIKENYERLWQENLAKEEDVKEEYDAVCAGIKALETKDVLDKIRAEIKEWYWQADKQALAKDPCVVDAMIDLFIRTIDKHKAESEDKE